MGIGSTTTVINPTYIKGTDFGPGAWAGVRGAVNGNPPQDVAPWPTVNQDAGGNTIIKRGLWWFDTMDLPSFANIIGARLKFHNCTSTFNGTVKIFVGTAPSNPAVQSDYDITSYVPSADFLTVTTPGMGGDQTITLNSASLSLIIPFVLGGYKFALLENTHDGTNTDPASAVNCVFTFDTLGDANPPTLEVDWNVNLVGVFMKSSPL